MKGRKHETYADFVEALLRTPGIQIRLDSEAPQNIRTANLARDSDIAVLGNRNASRRNDNSGRGGNVERLCPAASGSTSIYAPFMPIRCNWNAPASHHLREAGQLLFSLPLRGKRHQHRRD